MGFVEAIKSFYTRYFDFKTRSSRSEYWWVQLYYLIVLILLLIPIIGAMAASETGEPSDTALLTLIPFGLFILIGAIPMIAVSVRRFHDQDKSGWMYLLGLIPYVGGIIMIVFMCLKGTKGPNRFGMDPLGNSGDIFD